MTGFVNVLAKMPARQQGRNIQHQWSQKCKSPRGERGAVAGAFAQRLFRVLIALRHITMAIGIRIVLA
jgi:hypothetical protein